MKKTFKFLGAVLTGIIALPFIVIGLLVFFVIGVLPAPIEYWIYRKSPYSKSDAVKYRISETSTPEYIFYNLYTSLGISMKLERIGKNPFLVLDEGEGILLVFYRSEAEHDEPPKRKKDSVETKGNPYLEPIRSFQHRLSFLGECEYWLLIPSSELEDNEQWIEEAKGENRVIVYRDELDLIQQISSNPPKEISPDLIRHWQPFPFYRLLFTLSYLLFFVQIIPSFFGSNEVGWYIVGIFFGVVLLGFAVYQLNRTRIIHFKEWRLPVWIDRLLGYLAFFMLVSVLVSLFQSL